MLFRDVLTWLLMLSTPLQGFAGAAMLFCSPDHHGSASVAAVGAASEAATLAAPATEVQLQAHQHAVAVQHDKPSTENSALSPAPRLSEANPKGVTAAPLNIEKFKDGQCSACAACCTSAALLTAAFSPPLSNAASGSIPNPVESFLSHISEGFDPPPRTHFA